MKFFQAKQLILELSWGEKYTAAQAARKYRNKWIHFTDIPKLGINPQARHKDPPGIYFYPTNWIVNMANHTGFQYAITKKYYYICDIDLDSNGIDFGNVEPQTLMSIAYLNGWDEYYKKVLEDPKKYLKDYPRYQSNPTLFSRNKAAVFWATMDTLANEPDIFGVKMSWSKMLSAVFSIRDRKGIIAKGEAHQLLVLNPKMIKVLDHGENKSTESRHLRKIIQEIVADKYNGTIQMKQGNVLASFEYEEHPIRIKFDLGNYKMFVYTKEHGKWVSETVRFSDIFFSDYSSEIIKSNLAYKIESHLQKLDFKDLQKGSDYAWTKSEMMEIFKAITEKNHPRANVFFKDGKIWLTSFDTGGFFSNRKDNLEIVSHKNGTLSIEITARAASVRDEKNRVDFKRKFGPQKTVQDVLNAYKRYLSTLKKQTDLKVDVLLRHAGLKDLQ